jgi:3-phenylpropionate/trans-cinnamate dioxygenase ferredoxin subunit
LSDQISVSLAGAGRLAEGEKGSFKAGEFDVLVCRVRGALHALEDLCSHQNNPLCEGSLNGHLIVCSKHNAQFDVRDGKHQGPPAWTGIRVFDITESGDDAEVSVPVRKEKKALGIGPAPILRTR